MRSIASNLRRNHVSNAPSHGTEAKTIPAAQHGLTYIKELVGDSLSSSGTIYLISDQITAGFSLRNSKVVSLTGYSYGRKESFTDVLLEYSQSTIRLGQIVPANYTIGKNSPSRLYDLDK
ncbi:hypothetical protein AVEN_129440-1 [Araneus ventricosus]|uniref:Uncharacterized protein n=1 Tax=Araneus ventricosus TaxID=182803 RepID=A0A4Y2UX62_ARAVE|nr:hypothetical protein AVEN_129440-1 [Araneus ventricosus]